MSYKNCNKSKKFNLSLDLDTRARLRKGKEECPEQEIVVTYNECPVKGFKVKRVESCKGECRFRITPCLDLDPQVCIVGDRKGGCDYELDIDVKAELDCGGCPEKKSHRRRKHRRRHSYDSDCDDDDDHKCKKDCRCGRWGKSKKGSRWFH